MKTIYQLEQINGAWRDVSEQEYLAVKPRFGRVVVLALTAALASQAAPSAPGAQQAPHGERIDPLKALACMVLDAESGKTDQINSYAGVLRFVYDAVAASQAAPDTNFLDDLRRKVAAAPRRQFESAPGVYTNWLDQGAVLDIFDAARGESA